MGIPSEKEIREAVEELKNIVEGEFSHDSSYMKALETAICTMNIVLAVQCGLPKNYSVETFKAIPDYESEQTVLTQKGKLCAEIGEYVRKRDYDYVCKAIDEVALRQAKKLMGLEEVIESTRRKTTDGLVGDLFTNRIAQAVREYMTKEEV